MSFEWLKVPVVQAPMAGVTTPELVAAVCEAGALGSVGAGYMDEDELKEVIGRVKRLTRAPFAVNAFVPCKVAEVDAEPMKRVLREVWKEYFGGEFVCGGETVDFERQVEVVLEEGVKVFSFTFGVLDEVLLKELKRQDVVTVGTVTCKEELAAMRGVDAVVCQGLEAGGHRGGDGMVEVDQLLEECRGEVDLIAAGGLMDGQDVRRVLGKGAKLAQLGTAFLTRDECGATEAYKERLLEEGETRVTNVYTGKNARGIVNVLMERLEGVDVPGYPVQHYLTKGLRGMASKKGLSELMSLWAGTEHKRCRRGGAAELVQEISRCL